MTPELAVQIRRLLLHSTRQNRQHHQRRGHPSSSSFIASFVRPQASTIHPDAGMGVFAQSRIFKGQALCLYPGVYSAGIPPAIGSLHPDESVEFFGASVTPSGVDIQSNAYILNLRGMTVPDGGYIDGAALEVTETVEEEEEEASASSKSKSALLSSRAPSNDSSTVATKTNSNGLRRRRRRLDENPNACAHLVNHSPRHQKANVEVISFSWSSVLSSSSLSASLPSTASVSSSSTSLDVTELPEESSGLGKNDYDHDDETPLLLTMTALPNVARSDGKLRYCIGSSMDGMVYYQKKDDSNHNIEGVCGAVVCALLDIKPGEELLLDYELRNNNNNGHPEALPAWARGWYVS